MDGEQSWLIFENSCLPLYWLFNISAPLFLVDDWQLEGASNVFFLGHVINIEASVLQANHIPLRVFVDTCVANLAPDMNAVPSYAFIENKG